MTGNVCPVSLASKLDIRNWNVIIISSSSSKSIIIIIIIIINNNNIIIIIISRNIKKLTFWNVRITKTWISLRIRAVLFKYSFSAWRKTASVVIRIVPIRLCECWSECSLIYKGTFSNVKIILFHLRRTVVLLNKKRTAIIESRADNSVKHWLNLPISNPKPDLLNINACTKFG